MFSCFFFYREVVLKQVSIQRQWRKFLQGPNVEEQFSIPPRLLQEHELMPLLTAIQSMESEKPGEKQKPGAAGVLDTEQYGRGKRAREVIRTSVSTFLCRKLLIRSGYLTLKIFPGTLLWGPVV